MPESLTHPYVGKHASPLSATKDEYRCIHCLGLSYTILPRPQVISMILPVHDAIYLTFVAIPKFIEIQPTGQCSP